MKLCAVIPVYNHEHAIGQVVASLRDHDLPVLLVDDGSNATCAAVLDQLTLLPGVTLARHAHNQGKGGAVMTGLRLASQLGYTHALQIDSDGQHDIADVPRIVAAAYAFPSAIITGYPVYDDSVPRSRYYGRYATHIWIWINTLSFRIKDAMCGFRVYPLPATLALIDGVRIGLRMDFDMEILVRLDWRGVPIVNLPTQVHYPLDGVSHFKLWHDNMLISLMHTRLFFGMLPRLPKLLWRVLRGHGGMRSA